MRFDYYPSISLDQRKYQTMQAERVSPPVSSTPEQVAILRRQLETTQAAFVSATMEKNFLDNVSVPEHGVFTDNRSVSFERKKEEVIENIWLILSKAICNASV